MFSSVKDSNDWFFQKVELAPHSTRIEMNFIRFVE